MDDPKHELVSAIKGLAMELGHTPSHMEFASSVKGGHYRIRKHFGNYTLLLQAAGLDPAPTSKPVQINNEVFTRDLEKHLENYRPREAVENGPFPLMALISDIHWPFENRKVIEAFFKYVGQKLPEWVILNGDAWDMYSHGKFPRSHNVFTPREEQALARQKNEEFWQEIKKISPSSKCVQMLGNHDVRPMKRILEQYPEAEDWVAEKLKQLFTFDGVQTIFDAREELFVRHDIMVFHGYRTKLGDHMNFTICSTFNGHTHHGGTVFRHLRGQTIFECNSGFAGDPEAKGLTYTPQKTTTQTPGFAACDEWGPRFIPV
jgi:hypothetical protein